MAHLLEDLPTEIKILLLLQIDKACTLSSLLRASPKFWQVYRGNKEKFVTCVVTNQITPESLPIALLAQGVRIAQQPGNISLLNQNIHQRTNGYTDLSKLSTDAIQNLLRFHRLVEELANDAMSNSLLYIEPDLGSDSLEVSMGTISAFERCRAFRGFYNWQVLTMLGDRYFNGRWIDRQIGSLQLNEYFAHSVKLAFHELEEVHFAMNYLRERLSQCLDRAEDDRFNQFLAHGPHEKPYEFLAQGDDIFSSYVFRSIQNNWLGTQLYGQPLAVQHATINVSTPSARLKLFENLPVTARLDYWVALEHTLQVYRKRTASELTSPLLPIDWKTNPMSLHDFNTCYFAETIDNVTLGLLYACQSCKWPQPVASDCDIENLDRLVPMGLAIWDARRLRTMGIIRKDQRLMIGKTSLFLQRQNKPSVKSRVREQEDQWRAEGKMP